MIVSRRMTLWVGALIAPLCVCAQLVPDAPVEDFSLYGFDEETGFRVWQLQGGEGRYVSEEELEVENMRLLSYEATIEQDVRLRIESPLAKMFPKQMRAMGDSGIAVIGQEFFISGEDWLYLGKEQRLRIEQNVRVVFRTDIGSLLK